MHICAHMLFDSEGATEQTGEVVLLNRGGL
jgi:hypothetical protein